MSKKLIGEINYLYSNEVITYADRERFISHLQETIDSIGVHSVIAKVYNQSDLDLRYAVYSAIKGEYGWCEPKLQFLIDKGSPSFNLTEKLLAIHQYESTHTSKNTITWCDQNEIFLDDRLAETMSIKRIKNLIDRRYDKAIKRQNNYNNDNVDLSKPKKIKDSQER